MTAAATTTLRPFQQDARVQVNRLLNAGRHPVFVSPTGTGKTKTAIQIILDRVRIGQRVFILTPQEEIFTQWLTEFALAGIDYGYINGEGVVGRNKMIYVCMPMTLNNLLSVLPERFKPDVIVTDECHHAEAATWQNIHTYYPKAVRFGLTATPQRTDGKGLDNTYTDIVQTITMQEAIDAGYLAEPLLVVPEEYKLNVRMQNGDYDPEQQAEQLGTTRIIGDVVHQYSNIFAGLPVLVACSTYDHAQQMTESFNDAGWRFGNIHSKLATNERKALLRGVRGGTLNGLCTVGIGIEGMDIPGLYGLIWLRRTMSITIYLQFIGRVLRPAEGKRYGIIVDPVGNCYIHGRPQINREWSLAGRVGTDTDDMPAPKMKLCPVCSVMNAESNRYCHVCKYDFIEGGLSAGNKRKLPVMVDGKMVVLDGEELATRREEIRAGLAAQRETAKSGAGDGDGAENNGGSNARRITNEQKMDVLRNGLEWRKDLFSEAVKGYL